MAEPEGKKKRKKTPADFVAAKEAKEAARKLNTLTQWARNPPKPKARKEDCPGIITRKVFVNPGNGWREEVYDPKLHDVPRFRRHGEHCSDHLYKDNLEYVLCPKCRECNCGMCRLEERVIDFYSNNREIVDREHLMLSMTEGKRGNAKLDEEWCREQDPIWAQLKDRNSELKEDIGKYIADLEKRAMEARNEMEKIHGIVYPATGVKTYLVSPFLNL